MRILGLTITMVVVALIYNLLILRSELVVKTKKVKVEEQKQIKTWKPSLQAGRAKKQYPSLLEGLKRFPYRFPPRANRIVATIYGLFPGNGEYDEFKLVTLNGDLITIAVYKPNPERNLEELMRYVIFRENIWPMKGKYSLWSSVLYFKNRKNGMYHWQEIIWLGRFFEKQEDKDDPNKITDYLSEQYL